MCPQACLFEDFRFCQVDNINNHRDKNFSPEARTCILSPKNTKEARLILGMPPKETDRGSTHTHVALCIQFSQRESLWNLGQEPLIPPAKGQVDFWINHLLHHRRERCRKGFFFSEVCCSVEETIHTHLPKAAFLENNQTYVLWIESCLLLIHMQKP